MNSSKPLIKTFARTLARPLSEHKKMLMDKMLPTVSALEKLPLKYKDFSKLCLEIGFGNGKHLLEYSANNPSTLCIGADPYLNGVAQVLSKLFVDDKASLPNLLIHANDARQLFPLFNKYKLDQVFILYPDPWPKNRHNKKRLINAEFLMSLSQLLNKNGQIDIMTDHQDYANWILSAIKTCNQLKLAAYKTSDKPLISSKYETRGLNQNSKLHHFILKSL